MKRFFTVFAVLFMCTTMWAANMRVYCKMDKSWWKDANAAVGCHSWGTGPGTTWPGVRMTPVDGEADLWYIDLDISNVQNVIFTRVNGSGTIEYWGAKTTDQVIPTDGKDLFTITNTSACWADDQCTCGGNWGMKPCQTTYYTFDTIVCSSALPVTWRGFTFTQAGVQTTSVPHTDPSLICDSILTSYVLITRNCASDIVHDTLKLCIDSAAATLTPQTTGDAYEWSTGETTQSISVAPSKVGVQEYTCRVGTVGTVQLDKNIILNGGFEDTTHTTTNYIGFTSDYEFHAPKQPFNYGKSYRGFYKLDHSEYYGVNPHTGKFMMVCDGDENRKEAWSAHTTEPIIRGKQYRFSFWAANAFSGTSIAAKNCPKLSFYIEMNGKTYELVPEVTLPADVNWHQYGQNLSWTAPESAIEARVYLVDNCLANSNNDFALDDIVFQPLFGEDSQTTEVFPVKVDSCTTPEPPVPPVDPCEGFQTKKLYKDTTVCDTLLPFTWRGYTYTQPKSYYDTIRSLIGCGDSIITQYELKTTHCTPPEPETCLPDLVYAKWTNFLFCDNSKFEFTAYQWYCNDALMSGQTKQYLYLEAGMGQNQYAVEVTRTDGTKAKTCPLTYGEAPRSIDTYSASSSAPRRVVVPLGTNNLIVVFDENGQTYKMLQQR